MYGTGISWEGDLVDLGAASNIIEKSGAWFSYGGERIGQGRENAKQYLAEHPDIARAIEARVLEHYGLTARPVKQEKKA
jgi:recombination protein RecA